MLGRIVLVLDQDKPCSNAEMNPSVELVLTVYEYNGDTDIIPSKGEISIARCYKGFEN